MAPSIQEHSGCASHRHGFLSLTAQPCEVSTKLRGEGTDTGLQEDWGGLVLTELLGRCPEGSGRWWQDRLWLQPPCWQETCPGSSRVSPGSTVLPKWATRAGHHARPQEHGRVAEERRCGFRFRLCQNMFATKDTENWVQ